jgi:hypothetical protein
MISITLINYIDITLKESKILSWTDQPSATVIII